MPQARIMYTASERAADLDRVEKFERLIDALNKALRDWRFDPAWQEAKQVFDPGADPLPLYLATTVLGRKLHHISSGFLDDGEIYFASPRKIAELIEAFGVFQGEIIRLAIECAATLSRASARE
jgi:hypothetical protein